MLDLKVVTADSIWQIKIDGVIRGNYLFSSARMAGEEAIKLIDSGLFP
jgi:hypothetical protein